jgi:PAS domain S-box-containing protein/TyrR family helix-turn-helix protein
MILADIILKPEYSVDTNLEQGNVQQIIAKMKNLSLLEIPVLDKGRWAGIFRVFPSVPSIDFKESGIWISDAPYIYEDMDITELQIPMGYTIIGVVNNKEEFIGIIYVSDLYRLIQNMYKETLKQYHQIDAIIENTFDGIFIADALGYVTRVNPALCRLSGKSAQSFVGTHLTELVSNGVFENASITLKSLEEKREVTGIQRYTTGQEHLVSAVPILSKSGEIHGVVSNIRDMSELSQLRSELADYQSELSDLRKRVHVENIVAVSPQMRNVLELAGRVANFDSTVLILGESGVGKEVIASFIHKSSARSQGPFVKINCGAIPEELLESELFGYESGAFTGAKKAGKIGLFEAAEGGVIFLDEIGEMSPALQVKLLRVLQDQEFTRVGGIQPIKINCRIIAATHRNLQERIRNGLFREDLFYRLYVVPILIPPLRERKEDIPAFLQYFLNKYNKKYGTQKSVHPLAIPILQHHSWPGNVRQLSNLIERMVVTIPETVICQQHLPDDFFNVENYTENASPSLDVLKQRTKNNNTFNAFGEMERELIIQAISQYGSSRLVGQALGVSHTTIIKKMKKYGIEGKRRRLNGR